MSLQLLANATEFAEKSHPQVIKREIRSEDGHRRPFRCPVVQCARNFTSKRNLVDHCRGHHQGTKPHVCSFEGCGKSFLRPAHLIIHTRIHTGEKPFVCTFPGCGKRWNQKSALKQHIRSHTGEKPYSCTFEGCEKQFSTSSSCKRHIASHESAANCIGLLANAMESQWKNFGTSGRSRKKTTYRSSYSLISSPRYSSSSSGSSGDEAPLSPASSPPPSPPSSPQIGQPITMNTPFCMGPFPNAELKDLLPVMVPMEITFPEQTMKRNTVQFSENVDPVKMNINFLLN